MGSGSTHSKTDLPHTEILYSQNCRKQYVHLNHQLKACVHRNFLAVTMQSAIQVVTKLLLLLKIFFGFVIESSSATAAGTATRHNLEVVVGI